MNNLFQAVFYNEDMGKEKYNQFIADLVNELKQTKREINRYEGNMILNILQLGEISVKEIMIPRVDVHSIPIHTPVKEAVKKITERGVSRLPVFDENQENVIGMIHAKDLLQIVFLEEQRELRSILRQPYFIPESKAINDLLAEMRQNKIPFAVVVDEYGTVSGIVTLEDIVEKIVGKIWDEFDDCGNEIVKVGEDTYLVNARMALAEINRTIGCNILMEDIDTLSGLIYTVLGRIPNLHETLVYQNYLFTIESISGRKIKKVKIKINQQENIENGTEIK